MHTYKTAVLASLLISTFAGAGTPDSPAASPPKPAATSSKSQPASASDGPCQGLVTSAEMLYQQQQLDSAAVVVKQGLATCRAGPHVSLGVVPGSGAYATFSGEF